MPGGVRLSTGAPKRGEVIRDFALPEANGGRVQLSDYRGKKNLVVALAALRQPDLLKQLADRESELHGQQAQLLAVLAGTPAEAREFRNQNHLPFPVLADTDRVIHARLGATGANGQPEPALYVTDRFGEVFAQFRSAEGKALPSADEILSWLEFVNSQCEECFPPEWPA